MNPTVWTSRGAALLPSFQSISGFEVWEIAVDGLIAESQGSFDEASYQRQLQHGFEESQR